MGLAKPRYQPELLAPAGNIESFFAALEHGADSIYVGCRHLNARAMAANFTLEQIAGLTEYAHRQGVKLYVALNALVREEELEELVNILASLSRIKADGLIVQDAAIAHICRRHFPDLPLHASTLMTIHNGSGLERLQLLGFQRAVLARELTTEEVAQLAARTPIELEIFVHGALCFSYSGLCLASSYYGGRSSLRGRCVQPCRRLFRSGRDRGYFFSTNDLSAIDLIPDLRRLRIAAFKIEGRMKSASYIAAVVSAYRLVLDAPAGQEAEAAAKAHRLLKEASGRKPTSGFFLAHQLREIITPHRSGASGRLAAKVEWVRNERMGLRLRLPLAEGDRLRLDSDDAVEKRAFKLRGMVVGGQPVTEASAGAVVTVTRIAEAGRGDRLFKTGSKDGEKQGAARLRRALRSKTGPPPSLSFSTALARKILGSPKAVRVASQQPITLYLRLSQAHLLNAAFDAGARWLVLQATRANFHLLSRRNLPPARENRLIWALPAIIHEGDMPFYQEQVRRFQERGHTRWLLANWGHFSLFSRPPDLLIADYTLNVLNSQAGSLLQHLGCQALILSLENDRINLRNLLPSTGEWTPLLTVYGWPALFTSRLQIRPRQGLEIHGMGRDRLLYRRQGELTSVYSDRPLCLLEHLQELRKLGLTAFVLDLRGQRLHPREIQTLVKNVRRQQCPQPHSTFNYLGKLV